MKQKLFSALILFTILFGTLAATLPEARAATPARPLGLLTDDLEAYWTLDETSGTRADSVSTHDLTDHNTVGYNTGIIGNAADFTAASTEWLSTPDTAALSGGTNKEFTFAAWVYLDSISDYRTILQKNGTNDFALDYNYPAGRFRLYWGNTSVVGDITGNPGINTWHYVVAWVDQTANTLNIEVDNSGVRTTAIGSDPADTSADFSLGYPSNSNWTMDGRLDEVGVWSRVLTNDERTALYNSGAGCTYPFDECESGSNYLDYIHQTDAIAANAWLDGDGYTVAVLDTGIETASSRFSGRTIYQYDFWDDDSTAEDNDGHGTSVAGVVADVCPECDIAALKIADEEIELWDGLSINLAIHDALEWVIANRVSKNIVAVNISYGGALTFSGESGLNLYHSELQELFDAGVVITASAGNDYYNWQQPGVDSPANDPVVLGVSSVFHHDIGSFTDGDAEAFTTRAGQLAPFAERHANMSPIVAPGVNIPSANLAGGTSSYDGTSYSAPMVAAAVALLQDASEYATSDLLDAQAAIDTLLSAGSVTTDAYPDGTDNVLHTGSQFRVLNILAAINLSQTSNLVWQEGNYIQDGSMEIWSLWDNSAWGEWGSWPPFSQGLSSSYNSVGPLCDDNMRLMDAYFISAPSSVPSGVSSNDPNFSVIQQEFLWYGGPMFFSFGFMTSATAELSVELKDPFGNVTEVEDGLTNTASQWDVYYENLGTKVYGLYTLYIYVVSNNLGQRAAIDAVSMSEGGYQHCDYLEEPLNEPPAAGSFTLRSPPSLTFNTGNLLVNSALTSSTFSNAWANSSVATYFATGGLNGDGAVSIFGDPNSGEVPLGSINWIQVGSSVGDTGDNLSQTTAASGDTVYVSSTLNAGDQTTVTLSPLLPGLFQLVDVQTGERYSATRVETIYEGGEPAEGETPWFTPIWIFENLPLADYRVVVGEDNEFDQNEIMILIDDICAATDFLVITTICIPVTFFSDQASMQATLLGPQGTATAAAANTNQAQVIATGTALAYSNATATQRAQVTQTALVASGNATQYAAATATQRYSVTQTAYVEDFRSNLTLQAGATATKRAGATATRVAATQTQAGVYVITQAWQSTFNAQITQTVVVRETEEQLPPIIAQLTLQAGVNGTNSAQLTQQAQQQGTQEVNATATNNATAAAQLTQGAQQIATMQALATLHATQAIQIVVTAVGQQQQDTTLPPMTEWMWDEGCIRPTNAINVPAWIDYSTCRFMSWFSWQDENTAQVDLLIDGASEREPFATIRAFTDFLGEIINQISGSDWDSEVAGCNSGFNSEAMFADAKGILEGNFIFSQDQTNDHLFSQVCSLAASSILGEHITLAICVMLNLLCSTGLLSWFQLLTNLTVLIFTGVYIKRNWIDSGSV